MLSITITTRMGHIKKYCRKLKKENKKNREKENENNSNDEDCIAITIEDFLLIYDNDMIN